MADTKRRRKTKEEAEELAPAKPAHVVVVSVKASSLNVRESGPRSKVVGTLPHGVKVEVVETELEGEPWGRIEGKGFINLRYAERCE